jgi:hypothetical protein
MLTSSLDETLNQNRHRHLRRGTDLHQSVAGIFFELPLARDLNQIRNPRFGLRAEIAEGLNCTPPLAIRAGFVAKNRQPSFVSRNLMDGANDSSRGASHSGFC